MDICKKALIILSVNKHTNINTSYKYCKYYHSIVKLLHVIARNHVYLFQELLESESYIWILQQYWYWKIDITHICEFTSNFNVYDSWTVFVSNVFYHYFYVDIWFLQFKNAKSVKKR